MPFFMKKYVCLLCLACLAFSAPAQTVGLFQNDADAFNGYTLFAPTGFRTTWLIDNCGRTIKYWESDFSPGMMAYLLPDGHLLRSARIASNFSGGGSGGRLELFDWGGNLIWSYNYSTNTYHQHHDLHPLPNGNILILAWEKWTEAEALAAGRTPDAVTSQGIWGEKVVEVRPIGSGDLEVVWEWRLWDHLVQDIDPTKSNFGVVADAPGRVNINYAVEHGIDWVHCNSLDYNPELDQIMLSSRNFNELWVIDHATTTAEAAGPAGDLLYRWGNPAAWNRGTPDDQRFFGQHDAHWIPPGRPDAGKIMVFNNGEGRPDGAYSSVEIIAPPLNADLHYDLSPGQSYAPDAPEWKYTAAPPEDFFSPRISGAQRQPNGNTLICNGALGAFFEITPAGKTVWKYINPVGPDGPVAQGTNPVGNSVFQVIRYAPDYPAFENKNLFPGDPVELDPAPYACDIYTDTEAAPNVPDAFVRVLQNPVGDRFLVENESEKEVEMVVISPTGLRVGTYFLSNNENAVPTGDWPAGVLFVRFSIPETGA
ncbi:MAG: hypothetical protein D6714_14415, partial [Bacteroidetes bacterium]